MDNLAMDEKVVLGMDFLVEYGVFIDMGSNTVTIPRLNNHRPWSSVMELTQDASICIDPHKTATVMLLPLDKAQLPNLNTIGYVYPHKALPEGIVLWHGVQQVEGSGIRVG